MGQEARCQERIGERVVDVKALLEGYELILRGEHRARIAFANLDSVEAVDGGLTLHHAGEPIVLELGPAAERWAARIRNPPTLLDKLGVKDGQRVAAIGLTDRVLIESLRGCVGLVEYESLDDADWGHLDGADLDLVFVQITSHDDLDVLALAAQTIAQAGAVWVIHPKGRRDLKDTHVMAAGREAGLVDNKVARISETHTALRFVIPRANRRGATMHHKQR